MNIQFSPAISVCMLLLTIGMLPDSYAAWFNQPKEVEQPAANNQLPPEYAQLTNQLEQTSRKYDEVLSHIRQITTEGRQQLLQLQTEKMQLEQQIEEIQTAVSQLKKVNEQRYKELAEQQNRLDQAELLFKQKNEHFAMLMNAAEAEKALAAANMTTKTLQEQLTKKDDLLSQRDQTLIKQDQQLSQQKTTINNLRDGLLDAQQQIKKALSTNQSLHDELAALKNQIALNEQKKQMTITEFSDSLQAFESFLNAQTNQLPHP